MKTLSLDGRTLGWSEIGAAHAGRVKVRVAPAALRRVRSARAVVEQSLDRGDKVYGVNTGFGKLADRIIDRDDALKLQENLVISHAVGLGDPLDEAGARLLILFKLNSLVRGNSGCTPGLIQSLTRMIERDVLPVVPLQGSVGASGDLAPLSHLGLCMLGMGRALRGGRTVSASRALRSARLSAYTFQEKEGLCLINGTQFSLALLASVVLEAHRLMRTADAVGAMTIEGLMGSVRPFDARLHAARPHPGQIQSARNIRKLLRGSKIVEAHAQCLRVQDNYSLRCMPQVHGAAREVLRWTDSVVLTEANATSDNPLVFDADGSIVSGGNFHGMVLAHAADALAAALTTIGNISERRVEALTNPELSGLPAFLAHEGGVNSGYMMLQVEAAALAAENRTLCYPASVSNIPTSAGKEDMVSMSPISARKAHAIAGNVEKILAIEAMCAAQALDFRQPLQPGRGARAGHRSIRSMVAHADRDRYFKPELDQVIGLLHGRFLQDVEKESGSLE